MIRALLLGLALLGAAVARPGAPPVAAPCALPAPSPDAPRVDFASRAWTRNGAPAVASVAEEGSVRLPFTARGVRWATEFETEESVSVRLYLDWMPGPDGLLFEVVLDGVRLPPPRDGWRPSPRELRSDLGPAWLGSGAHVLEFVGREEASLAALHLRGLELAAP